MTLSIEQFTTNATCISCDNVKVYFSYETIIAFQVDAFQVKTDQYYSLTTSKHKKKMGLDSFIEIPEKDFDILRQKISLTIA